MDLELPGDFDVRPSFIRKILMQHGSSSLTNTELMIAQNQDILFAIDEKYRQEMNEQSLWNFLTKISSNISYRDSTLFLLDCYEDDNMTVAFETLNYAYEQRMNLTAEDLLNIIHSVKDNMMIPSLMVNLIGTSLDENDEQDDDDENTVNMPSNSLSHQLNSSSFNNSSFVPPTTQSSGLNRNAMDDFLNGKNV